MIPIDSDTFLTLTAAFKYVVSNPDQFAKQGQDVLEHTPAVLTFEIVYTFPWR